VTRTVSAVEARVVRHIHVGTALHALGRTSVTKGVTHRANTDLLRDVVTIGRDSLKVNVLTVGVSGNLNHLEVRTTGRVERREGDNVPLANGLDDHDLPFLGEPFSLLPVSRF